MAGITDGPLASEVVEAVMSDPRMRRRAERAMEALFEDLDYSIRFGVDPSPLTRAVMPALLRSLQSAQQTERQAEAAAHLAEVRSFVAQFRRRRTADE